MDLLTRTRLGLAALFAVAACSDTVVETVPIETFELAVTDTAVEVGDSVQLPVSVTDDQGNALSGRAVAWSSGDASVATVNQQGWVEGVAVGTTQVTATVASFSDSAEVEVLPVSVREVELDRDRDTLFVAGTTRLVATLRDRDGNVLAGEAAWSSTDTSIAVVRQDGGVLAVGPGTVSITASADDASASVLLTVRGTRVWAGAEHTCALDETGTAYCWGQNDAGEVGDGSTTSRTSPVPVSGGHAFRQLAVGSGHTCGVTTDGAAYCWGVNDYGELGDGTHTPRTQPRQVLLPGGVVLRFVTAGSDHTCGLTVDGAVLCWGSNDEDQLGDGSGSGSTIPVAVELSGAEIRSVVSGSYHNCAVDWDDRLYCWGENTFGQIGDGSTTNRPTPVEILAPDTAGYHLVSPGDAHTCALTTDGAAYCWGANDASQLGDGTSTASTTPVAVSGGHAFTILSTRGYHACGVTTLGATLCWGDNDYGQHGSGDAESTALPTASAVGLDVAWLSAGLSHTCAVDDGIYCWGDRGVGKVGDGSTAMTLTPVSVSGGLSFATVRTGFYSHTCGVTTDGDAYCWGSNDAGQLGDGGSADSTVPVAVAAGADTTFAVVTRPGSSFSCGLTTDGSAFCWGGNWSGQLGDGSFTDRATPVRVSGGLVFDTIAGGYEHACGIANDGGLLCWGYNWSGQVGDGSTTDRGTPVQVMSGTTFTAVAAGSGHTCAIATAGSLYCWGDNSEGQLGDGTTTDRTTPVDVTPAGATFTEVAAGNANTCAIGDDGSAYCWGTNWDGEVGNGATTARETTPATVSGGYAFAAISVGDGHTCGVTTTGTTLCWGRNDRGQYGTGTTVASTTPVEAPTGVAPGALDANAEYTCGITAAGSASCWGHREYGLLGDGLSAYALSPVAILLP